MSPAGEKTWNLWDESPPPLPVDDGLIATGRTDRTSAGLGGSVVRRVLDRASPGISNRGRAYARAGQTVSVDFEQGRIYGEVQGSDPLPYQVEITCDVPETDQRRFVRALHHTLPEPVTEVPESFTRDLRRELAEYRILVDAALTVRCNCSYRGVCKHLVAFGYVAGEHLDQSPANIGALLGITDADIAGPETDGEPTEDDDAEPEPAVFDRKRQAQLARTLASIDKREPLTRDEVLSRAADVLLPSATVANALDLDLYLDPVDSEGDGDSEE